MVCERDPASPNDPAEGRIVARARRRLAEGGRHDARCRRRRRDRGDDGARRGRVAAHGPLELLMTVAEEVGLEGANALDGSLLTGSTLINLDSEEDGVLTVGCAGSTDTWIRIDAPRSTPDAEAVTLDVIVPRRTGRALGHGDRARAGRTRSRFSGARSARRTRRCRSGSSRSTVARAGTRSRVTRTRSSRSSRTSEAAFRGRARLGDRDDSRRVREDGSGRHGRGD